MTSSLRIDRARTPAPMRRVPALWALPLLLSCAKTPPVAAPVAAAPPPAASPAPEPTALGDLPSPTDLAERMACLDGDGPSCDAWRQGVTQRIVATLQQGDVLAAGSQVRELCGLLDPELADLRCMAGQIEHCSPDRQGVERACILVEGAHPRCEATTPYVRQPPAGWYDYQEVPAAGFTVLEFDEDTVAGPLLLQAPDGTRTWLPGLHEPGCHEVRDGQVWVSKGERCTAYEALTAEVIAERGIPEADGVAKERVVHLVGAPGLSFAVATVPPRFFTGPEDEVDLVPWRTLQEVTLDGEGQATITLPAGMRNVVLNGMDLLPNGPGPWRYYVGQSRYDGLARPIAQPGDRCRAGEVEGPCEEVAYGLEGERYLVEDRGDHLQLSPLVEVLPMVSPPMDEPYFEGNYGFYREQDTAIWLPVGGEYVVDDYRMCARATVTGPGPLPMMQRLCGDPSPMALRTTTGEAVGPVFASQSAVGTDGNAWLHPRDVRYLPGGQPLYPAGEPLTATLTGRWVTEDGDQHVVTEVQWTGTDGDGDRMNDGTAPVVHWPGGAWADGHLFLGTEAERWVDTCHGRFEALTPLP